MKDEQVKIDVDRMIDKALTYKGKHIVTICDLMTDDEEGIFCHMNESEKNQCSLTF